MRVVYTDSAWALDTDGRPNPELAIIEREVLGPDIDIQLGHFESSYVTVGDRFLDTVRGADALVIYRCQVTPELVASVSPQCKVIGRSGVGIDNLNGSLLAENGIYAFNVPDYCGDEVTTHTVAMLLGLERNLCVQDSLVKAGRWGIHRGGIPRRTAGRTLGIVGFGRVGRAVVRKAEPFYGQVLAFDPYVSGDVMAGYGVTATDSLAELLGQSDAVLLHAELTDETRNLFNEETLSQVKPGALLVNTARGALVDPEAVLGALEAGRLGGYASDVFSPEDPNKSPDARKLLERDDVIVSSHRAFLSAEAETSLRRRVAAGIRSVLVDGTPPVNGRVA